MDVLIWLLLILFWACLVWLSVLATIYVFMKIDYIHYKKYKIKYAKHHSLN